MVHAYYAYISIIYTLARVYSIWNAFLRRGCIPYSLLRPRPIPSRPLPLPWPRDDEDEDEDEGEEDEAAPSPQLGR